jgi:hypothetical protein
MLSVLKSQRRRAWAHERLSLAAKDVTMCESLSSVAHESLTDAQATAYMWLANCFLNKVLSTGPHSSRVLLVNGERLANAPEAVLPAVATACGLRLDAQQVRQLVNHPSVASYSKALSKPYDATWRRQELARLEACYGAEADAGMEWAASRSISNMPNDFLL